MASARNLTEFDVVDASEVRFALPGVQTLREYEHEGIRYADRLDPPGGRTRKYQFPYRMVDFFCFLKKKFLMKKIVFYFTLKLDLLNISPIFMF